MRFFLPLVGLLAAACQAPSYRYEPAPLESFIEAEDGSTKGRALVTVLRAIDASEGTPAAVDLRMRLENLGTNSFQLADDLMFVSADLIPFESVQPPPEAFLAVLPGTTSTFDLRFQLPGGKKLEDLDLTTLNLRWTVFWGGGSATTSSTFVRVYPVPVYDYYPYYFGFGFSSDCVGMAYHCH